MSHLPERWLEISVSAPADEEARALVVERLLGLGCRGALERDGRLVGWLPEPVDGDAVERSLGALEVSLRWLAHEDWAETWKVGLAPRRVGRRIVVAPSWDVPEPGADDLLVVVDPGMAFGTAEHGTTRGCLRLLESAVRAGDAVLDVGAGSGILSVAAARLGAGRVVAVEADPLAWETLAENLEANGVADRATCVPERADAARLRALGPVDGLVANLDAATLRGLDDGLLAAVRPGGWLIVSGLTEGEWPAVARRLEASGLRLLDVEADEGWCAGLFAVPPPTPRA